MKNFPSLAAGLFLFGYGLVAATARDLVDQTREVPASAPSAIRSHYRICNASTSPDGRFGVISPTEGPEKFSQGKISLVSLRPFKIIAQLGNIFPYFKDHGVGGITANWLPDSSAATITMEGRWGPGFIFLCELRDGKVARTTDLLTEMHKVVRVEYEKANAVKRVSDDFDFAFIDNTEFDVKRGPLCQFIDTGKIRIDAIACVNIKADDLGGWAARLQAEWDIAAARFTKQTIAPETSDAPATTLAGAQSSPQHSAYAASVSQSLGTFSHAAERNSGNAPFGVSEFEFTLGGYKYTIKENGNGKRTGGGVSPRSFKVPVERGFSIIRMDYAEYQGDVVLSCEDRDVESVGDFIVRLDRKTLTPKWKQLGGGGLIEEDSVYAIGWSLIGKLGLSSGAYVWKHDNLYNDGHFQSFDPPKIEGEFVAFTEHVAAGDRTPETITVQRQSGEVVSNVKAAPNTVIAQTLRSSTVSPQKTSSKGVGSLQGYRQAQWGSSPTQVRAVEPMLPKATPTSLDQSARLRLERLTSCKITSPSTELRGSEGGKQWRYIFFNNELAMVLYFAPQLADGDAVIRGLQEKYGKLKKAKEEPDPETKLSTAFAATQLRAYGASGDTDWVSYATETDSGGVKAFGVIRNASLSEAAELELKMRLGDAGFEALKKRINGVEITHVVYYSVSHQKQAGEAEDVRRRALEAEKKKRDEALKDDL